MIAFEGLYGEMMTPKRTKIKKAFGKGKKILSKTPKGKKPTPFFEAKREKVKKPKTKSALDVFGKATARRKKMGTRTMGRAEDLLFG